MKTLKIIFPFLLLFMVSCSDDKEETITSEQQGGIKNVTMISQTTQPGPVKITADAIGNDGCWSNLRLELEKVSTYKYNLRSYGTVIAGGGCTMALVQEKKETSFTPTAQGTYEITVYNTPKETSKKTLEVIFTR
jgi:hypothetical protein